MPSSMNQTLEWLHDRLSFLMPLQTIQLVSVFVNIVHILNYTVWLFVIVVTPEDYISDTGLLSFATGDARQCHRVQIVNNDICETELEQFLSNLVFVSGVQRITVDPASARVIIDDTDDCGKYCFCLKVRLVPYLYAFVYLILVGVFVNDTLTGDPLMTVPIFTDPLVRPGDDFSSLCYEVHGAANASFNLITDECTSVNAYYQQAVTPSPNIDLNVVTQIGVRTVGSSGRCWNIQVNLNMCEAIVNGEPPVQTFDGISVKRYNGRRVRISVPNCADATLVMWVMCRNGEVEDPVTWEYFNINFIRFVVTRGLNLNERSHGIMGNDYVSIIISLIGGFVSLFFRSVLECASYGGAFRRGIWWRSERR